MAALFVLSLAAALRADERDTLHSALHSSGASTAGENLDQLSPPLKPLDAGPEIEELASGAKHLEEILAARRSAELPASKQEADAKDPVAKPNTWLEGEKLKYRRCIGHVYPSVGGRPPRVSYRLTIFEETVYPMQFTSLKKALASVKQGWNWLTEQNTDQYYADCWSECRKQGNWWRPARPECDVNAPPGEARCLCTEFISATEVHKAAESALDSVTSAMTSALRKCLGDKCVPEDDPGVAHD